MLPLSLHFGIFRLDLSAFSFRPRTSSIKSEGGGAKTNTDPNPLLRAVRLPRGGSKGRPPISTPAPLSLLQHPLGPFAAQLPLPRPKDRTFRVGDLWSYQSHGALLRIAGDSGSGEGAQRTATKCPRCSWNVATGEAETPNEYDGDT
jgi:hypothetical protein